MNDPVRITYTERASTRLSEISNPRHRDTIERKIQHLAESIADSPLGRHLSGSMPYVRVPSGRYRIIYEVVASDAIKVVDIGIRREGSRKDVYFGLAALTA